MSKPYPNGRFRAIDFTCFDMDMPFDEFEGIAYMVVGKETCPDTARLHWQGMAQFKEAKSGKQVWEMFKKKGVSFRRVRNAKALRAYCKKGGEFKEWGTFKVQGRRTDIQAVRDIIGSKRGMRAVVEEVDSYQAIRTAEKILQYAEPKRDWKTEVYWYWGPTGTGKTQTAIREAGPDHWISGAEGKWWQGYDAHENVIIDDYRCDMFKFRWLLRLLDCTGATVENKGGSRQLLAKKIWITAPKHWREMWAGRCDEDLDQLKRRITKTIQFGFMDISGHDV